MLLDLYLQTVAIAKWYTADAEEICTSDSTRFCDRLKYAADKNSEAFT